MLYNLSWEELNKVASDALTKRDAETLKGLDDALHFLFFNEAKNGNAESRLEFAAGLLAILESKEALAVPAAGAEQRSLMRWTHLSELMETLRKPVTDAADAERFLKSRDYGMRLLDIVARAGAAGIASGELAGQLGVAKQQLSSSLADFEEKGIIVRVKEGKNVFIVLGLRGEILADAQKPASQSASPKVVPIFPETSRIRIPLEAPRQYLMGAA